MNLGRSGKNLKILCMKILQGHCAQIVLNVVQDLAESCKKVLQDTYKILARLLAHVQDLAPPCKWPFLLQVTQDNSCKIPAESPISF